MSFLHSSERRPGGGRVRACRRPPALLRRGFHGPGREDAEERRRHTGARSPFGGPHRAGQPGAAQVSWPSGSTSTPSSALTTRPASSFLRTPSIGEVLLVCRRWSEKGPKPPTRVVNLARNPATPVEALDTAARIERAGGKGWPERPRLHRAGGGLRAASSAATGPP